MDTSPTLSATERQLTTWTPDEITKRCNELERSNLLNMLEQGRLLEILYSQLGEDAFNQYVDRHMIFSVRTAWNYYAAHRALKTLQETRTVTVAEDLQGLSINYTALYEMGKNTYPTVIVGQLIDRARNGEKITKQVVEDAEKTYNFQASEVKRYLDGKPDDFVTTCNTLALDDYAHLDHMKKLYAWYQTKRDDLSKYNEVAENGYMTIGDDAILFRDSDVFAWSRFEDEHKKNRITPKSELVCIIRGGHLVHQHTGEIVNLQKYEGRTVRIETETALGMTG